ncbi:MAG TPA: hypothetical protein VFC63_04650 [Blastocatellia bacterium]|nr:hypothetical protein [Blastocatellia bacterium]
MHPDFNEYYSALVEALEFQFGIQFPTKLALSSKPVFWMYFRSNVDQLNALGANYGNILEAGLLIRKLEEAGVLGEAIFNGGRQIAKAIGQAEQGHKGMLYNLFILIFGEQTRVVTSADLLEDGFDDSREPDIMNYQQYI